MFDLDETLVRVQKEEPQMQYDTRINVVDHASNHSYFVSNTNLKEFPMLAVFTMRLFRPLAKKLKLEEESLS